MILHQRPHGFVEVVVENEALKMTIEDLERYLANCKSELVEARANASKLDQARKDLKAMREALYEIHGILDTAGFCPDEHYE